MTFAAPATGVLSGPTSEFRRDVRSAPVHPASAHVVAHLAEQAKLSGANLNCLQYGLAVYEVDENEPVVDVAWTGHTNPNDAGFAGLLGPTVWDVTARANTWPARTAAFRGVPIPDAARPAVGSDGAMAVYRRSTDELWEFWQARRDAATGKWSAGWGGYVPGLLSNSGQHAGTFGVCASGLVAASGAITVAEARAGRIDHALGLALPHIVGKVWSYPAVRCDGSGTSTLPTAIHEGQRFRLRANVDVANLMVPPTWSGARPTPMHPLGKVIATAAQTYGFVVTDRAGSVAVAAEEGVGALAAGATANPWTAILGGAASWQVLLGFPWDACEALPFDYGKGMPR